MFIQQERVPEVIVCNFKKSDADTKVRVESRRNRFGKSLIPPVLFLQDANENDCAEFDGVFMESYDVNSRIHLVRIED